MDNLNRAYKAQCKELERLAMAAATMNYSQSMSGQNIQGVSQQQAHLQPQNLGHVNPVPHSLSSVGNLGLSSSTSMPISFIDSYQIPMQRAAPTFSHIHSFDASQPFHQESSQPFPGSSRLVMPTHQTTGTSYNNRPITHFAVSGMPSLHFPNNNAGITNSGIAESQIPQIQHHESQVLNFAPIGVGSGAGGLTTLPHAQIAPPVPHPPPPPHPPAHPPPHQEQPPIPLCKIKQSIPHQQQEMNIQASSNSAGGGGMFIDSLNLMKKRKEAKMTSQSIDRSIKESLADVERAAAKIDASKPDDDCPYFCTQCDMNFTDEDKYTQHCAEHGNQIRRTGLALETKVEIIKRILSGEKRMDMAEEYGVNRSTIKSIMKKRNTYLNIWKKGMYNPCAKRLKGPKREDVEEATHRWYLQAIKTGDYISGPVLCNKALDFAAKLGRPDFKPTHGWLDRFKKRKNIVFGRKPSKAKREKAAKAAATEQKVDEWEGKSLPKAVLDMYDPSNIFALEEVGMFYQAMPNQVSELRYLDRCPGGLKANLRFSIVLCANMTGTEKFPLLVAGKYHKMPNGEGDRNLPLHYVYDNNSWITQEIFSAWLCDVDSWFIQQGRKVCLLVPPLPTNCLPPKLLAVHFISPNQGFTSPLKQGAITAVKKHYRKLLMEAVISKLEEAKKNCTEPIASLPKVSASKCLSMLSSAWQSLPEGVFVSSFQRSGLTNPGLTNLGLWATQHSFDTALNPPGAFELLVALSSFGFNPHDIQFEEFVHFDDEIQTCNMMGDEDILVQCSMSKSTYKKEKELDLDEEERMIVNGGGEAKIVPTLANVKTALSGLRSYIQYQEGAREMFRVLAHMEYLIYKTLPQKSGIINSQP